MALRRPKKMSRPPNCTSNGSSASTVASRLGPGMETINLTFTPTHAQDSQKDMSGVDGAAELESPWFIHWQVGVGASVDRGLRLAKVVRVGVSNPGGRAGGQDIERSVFAPREGILTELLIPTGGEVGVTMARLSLSKQPETPPQDATRPSENCAERSGERSAKQPPQEGTTTASTTAELSSLETRPHAETSKRELAVDAAPSTTKPSHQATTPEKRFTVDDKAVVIGRLSFCGHPELHGTLCTSCGRNVVVGTDTDEYAKDGGGRGGGEIDDDGSNAARRGGTAKVTMKGGGTLTLSSTAAKKMAIDKSGRLLSSKRLALVLDLDNTLLHCSDHPDAGRIMVSGAIDGIHALRLPSQPKYYIKLRPGLRTFLEQAATMFEMTIYTAGTSQYADAVAHVLDPDRRLFQGRHFSTCFTPDLGRNTKSLERIFPCGLDMALIVDDRDDVWRGEQAKNLLLVRPYKFFVGQRSVPGGPTHDSSHSPVESPFKNRSPDVSPVRDVNTASGSSTSAEVGESAPGEEQAEKVKHGDDDRSVESKSSSVQKPNGRLEGVEPQPTASLDPPRDPGSGLKPAEKISLDSDDGTRKQGLVAQGDGAVPPSGSESLTTAGEGPVSLGHGSGSTLVASNTAQKLGQGLAALLAEQRKQRKANVSATSEPDDETLSKPDDGGDEKVPSTKTPMSFVPFFFRRSKKGGDERHSSLNKDQPRIGVTSSEQSDIVDLTGTSGPSLNKDRPRIGVTSSEQSDIVDLTGTSEGDEPAPVAPPTPSPPDEKKESGTSDGDDVVVGKSSGDTSQESESSAVTPAKQQSENLKAADGERGEEKENGARVQRGEMLAPMSPPPPQASPSGSAENDPQLDCTLKTLEAVHGAFYAPENNQHGQPRDVAFFLAKVRSRVLRGVRMVFSGVIPVSGAPADQRTHKLWRIAEAHGATVEAAIGRDTTHVVAARLGTAKTSKGLRMPGVFVVHLDWLMNSVWHCRRERETLFLLAGQICGGTPPSPPPVPTTPPPLPITLASLPGLSSSSTGDPASAHGQLRDASEETSRSSVISRTISRDSSSTTSDEEQEGGDGGSPRARKRRRNNAASSLNSNSARGCGGAVVRGDGGLSARSGGDITGESGCGSSSRSSSVGSESGEWLNVMADELDSL